MLVVDNNDNLITDYDLDKGYLVDGTIINPNATPIDDVTKFAWSDEDHIPVKRYIAYTEEELERFRQQPIEELKEKLADTDYIAAKSMDKLLLCTTPEEIVEVTAYYKEKYSDLIEQRQEWRDEINRLNNEKRKAAKMKLNI